MAKPTVRRWIRRGFVIWAAASMLWLANSMRTRGVDDDVMRSGDAVVVIDGSTTLQFVPTSTSARAGLVFVCGSGVSAHAYAPMLRPIADAGYRTIVVKLPYRFAPLESHKQEAMARVREAIAAHGDIAHWVVAGHSLGAALAARIAHDSPALVAAVMLIGTTHPKDVDMSSLQMAVTKVYASNDGVAPVRQLVANAHLLPKSTKWVQIEGGNHSQFGHYGHQLFDGKATISREAQQAETRAAILEALAVIAR